MKIIHLQVMIRNHQGAQSSENGKNNAKNQMDSA